MTFDRPPFVDGSAYLGMYRDEQIWLAEYLLPVGGLLNIYGPPKAGKTFAAMDLAMAISDPKREYFLAWKICKHGPVWYLQIDTPRAAFQERWQNYVNAGHYINGVFIADTDMVPYPFNITAEGGQFLRDAVSMAEVKPVLIIIDTIRDAHGFDENDSGIMRNVLAAFKEAAQGAALVFLTHEKKLYEGGTVDLMSGSRGSNYLAGRVDSVMRVTKKEIRAEGRSLEETILSDLARSPEGLWVMFDGNREIVKYLNRPFKNTNQRIEAFIAEWPHVKKSTAENYFRNFELRGDFRRTANQAKHDETALTR